MAKAETQMPKPILKTVTHLELNTTEPATLRKTLETLFGWTFETVKMPGGPDYHMFRTPDGNGGGVTTPQPGQPTIAVPYVSVDNLEDVFKRAKKAGAEIVVPITPVPNMGSFFQFRTKGGPAIGVWKDANQ